MATPVSLLKRHQRLRLDLLVSLLIFLGSFFLLIETWGFPAIARWFPVATLTGLTVFSLMRLLVFVGRLHGLAGGYEKELGTTAKYDFQASVGGVDQTGFFWLGLFAGLGILAWVIGAPFAVALWVGLLLNRTGELAFWRAAAVGAAVALAILALDSVNLIKLPEPLLSRLWA